MSWHRDYWRAEPRPEVRRLIEWPERDAILGGNDDPELGAILPQRSAKALGSASPSDAE